MSFFEMSHQLVDVISYKKAGYFNCVDITVDSIDHSFLLANGIISHNSAMGGLLPSLGRNGNAYYMLKGKPLNAYSSNQAKFLANKELSNLYQIIKNGVEIVDKPDGDWYKLYIDGQEMIVNINDEVKIGNDWVSVKEIIEKNS